jgi:predicted PurR-regulated permease PerM
VLALAVLVPYLQYVLFGVVLAYVLYPLQLRLEAYTRPTFAAVGVVVTTLLVVLIPVLYVLTIAVQQAFGVVSAIRDGRLGITRIEALLAANGVRIDLLALYETNQERIAGAIQSVAMSVLDIVGSLPKLFIGVTVTLFVLFALLREGEQLVAWFGWVLPLADEDFAELRGGLDDLMWASVVGNVAVAAIQAVMLGVGLFVAGVPAIVFLTVATFVLTLLPLVGAFGVWLPAAAYLLTQGRPVAAGALVVYGLFVTFSDSYLRPALIGQTAGLNAAVIIVGIFGGLVVFGAVGLFIGPVVLGGTKLVLDVFARRQVKDGPDPPVGDPEGGADASPD